MKRLFGFLKRYAYAAAACLYLFVVGFVFAKNRVLLNTICSHFGYGRQATRTIIPKMALAEIAPETIRVEVRQPVAVSGNVSLLEIIVMARLIRLRQPDQLFEIGTFDGRTTLNMAANCPTNAKVYTLDLPRAQLHSTKLPLAPGDITHIDKERSGSHFLGTAEAAKIVQLFGDSARFDFSPWAAAIDFVFIDGSHSYEYVLNDSRKALQLLRSGRGVILWHDYGVWEGVTRALNELYSQGEEFKNLRNIEETSIVCLFKE